MPQSDYSAQFQQLDELYREVILDHYSSPRNRRRIESPDAEAEGYNPLCGDDVTVQLRLEDGAIADAAFEGQGCSISQASASMLTEQVQGLSLAEAQGLAEAFRRLMQDGAEVDQDLGDLEALTGVKKFPVRVKCATLAWNALLEALVQVNPP